MIPSVVNPKVMFCPLYSSTPLLMESDTIPTDKHIHAAMKATIDPYEASLDSGMDFIEPETPEPEYFGPNRGCFEEPAVPCVKGLARTLKKLGIPEVLGVLEKKRVNGYYRCKLLCLDGSVLEDDVEMDELKTLPELRKGSAFEEWIGGNYPTDPLIESAFFKMENKDKLSSCVLCGRTLTHPVSIKRHVGPECLKKIPPSGNTFVQGNEVTQGLIDASEKYSEERFRKWIIRAVLTLNAPLPEKTLKWLGNEFFGYSNKPSLYYLSADDKLNCIEIKKKHLTNRQITSLSTCMNGLDYHAWGMVRGKELPFKEFEAEGDSPRQWLFFDGDARPCVYLEQNGHLWCNCHRPECLVAFDKNFPSGCSQGSPTPKAYGQKQQKECQHLQKVRELLRADRGTFSSTGGGAK